MGGHVEERDIEANPPDLRPTGIRSTESFDEVYAEQRIAIVRVAYLVVRSQEVAEELTQEAFLRLYTEGEAVENPRGFLRTVVVRLALTWRERAEMGRERVARLPTEPSPPMVEPDETWEALGRLRPERAAVLVLRYYEDLSHGEIARILHCPTATVRSRVRRALADLRKELEP